MSHGDIVLETQVTWANSAPLNTAKVVVMPSDQATDFIVEIRNPSTVSDISAVASVTEPESTKFDSGGGALEAQVSTWTAAKNQAAPTRQAVTQWVNPSQSGKLTLKNATVLGGSDGFTADIRIRRA